MSGMASAPSELPYAAQLVEPVADILVSMASHSVTWAVEQLILPFLQLGWKRASAAYTAASMRALVAILDVESEFSKGCASSAHGSQRLVRMQREVPTRLAPHIERILRAAYEQVGLQRVGLRYAPLGLCTRPGAADEPVVEAAFLSAAQQWEAAFTADFGQFTPTSPRSPAALAATGAGAKPMLLRLTMYHGAMPEKGDEDDDMLHLSYPQAG